MQPPILRYLEFLGRSGVRGIPGAPGPGVRREPDHDRPVRDERPSPLRHAEYGPPEVIEHCDPAGGVQSDHATHSVGRVLLAMRSELAGTGLLELGCGTGLLAVLGARWGARVVGTDVDPRAVELARRNVEANDVAADLRAGSLCGPLRAGERFEWCVANLPHKPVPAGSELPISQDGGPEGDRLFGEALPELTVRQPAGARLVFFLHSLPHPRLLASIARHYALELASWKLRWLQPGEYGELRGHFGRRHESGTSFLWRDGAREALVCGVWVGIRRADS